MVVLHVMSASRHLDAEGEPGDKPISTHEGFMLSKPCVGSRHRRGKQVEQLYGLGVGAAAAAPTAAHATCGALAIRESVQRTHASAFCSGLQSIHAPCTRNWFVTTSHKMA
jgi:hypothetical protein